MKDVASFPGEVQFFAHLYGIRMGHPGIFHGMTDC